MKSLNANNGKALILGPALVILGVVPLMAGCSSKEQPDAKGESSAQVMETDAASAPADDMDQSSSADVDSEPVAAPPIGSPAPKNSPVSGDFADGDAGGPDFWAVRGVASSDSLNVRATASTTARIVGSVPNGTVLRNLGCRNIGQSRWCRVGSLADDGVDGWVNARFLRESGPPMIRPVPATRPTEASRPPAGGVPELVRRNTGEYEIRYSGGCTVLLDAGAKVLNRGTSCSPAQLSRAVKAVEGYRREQGL